MLQFSLRSTLKNVVGFGRSHYCFKTFDALPRTIPLETKPTELTSERKITKELIQQLEAISLVNFGNEKGVKIVEDAISYADKLEEINTDCVEPLYTVLEKESLYLRVDSVKTDIERPDLLSHSEKIVEEYYAAAVGSIAYDSGTTEKISEKVSFIVNKGKIEDPQTNC